MTAQVDLSKFNLAFKAYLQKTSKKMEEAINWKASDLMLTAAQQTPKTKLRPEVVKAWAQRPRLVTYRTGRKFGNSEGKGWTRPQWDLVRSAMAAKELGKGFMRSAWVKAARKIPLTLKGKKLRGDDLEAARLTKSRADVRAATGKIKEIAASLYWDARSDKDAAKKQEIVTSALAKALPIVTKSMIDYLNKENVKNAKSVSA